MEHNQTIATGQSIPHIVGYHQGGELAAVYNVIGKLQHLSRSFGVQGCGMLV